MHREFKPVILKFTQHSREPIVCFYRLLLCAFIPGFGACTKGVEPECEWCGASEAPTEVAHSISIVDSREPGERVFLSGKDTWLNSFTHNG